MRGARGAGVAGRARGGTPPGNTMRVLRDRGRADAIFGVSVVGGISGTLSRCGHYGMHLPLGDSLCHREGLCVREGCLSLRGSCHVGPSRSSATLGSLLSPQRCFSSWGCFCVTMEVGVIGVLWI